MILVRTYNDFDVMNPKYRLNQSKHFHYNSIGIVQVNEVQKVFTHLQSSKVSFVNRLLSNCLSFIN